MLSCYAYRSDTQISLDSNRNLSIEDNDVTSVAPNTKDYPNPDGYMMQCPRFANNGCFKANFTEGTEDIEAFRDSFHKGCSMYDLGDDEQVCREIGNLGTACKGKNNDS